MALVNRYILVEYDVGGPRLWHERWALEHVGGDSYIVVTPDRDIYSEDLGLLNSDLRGIRVRPAPGVVPPEVNAAEIYALPMWNVGEVQAIRDEARQVALQAPGSGSTCGHKLFLWQQLGWQPFLRSLGPLCLLVRHPMPAVS